MNLLSRAQTTMAIVFFETDSFVVDDDDDDDGDDDDDDDDGDNSMPRWLDDNDDVRSKY